MNLCMIFIMLFTYINFYALRRILIAYFYGRFYLSNNQNFNDTIICVIPIVSVVNRRSFLNCPDFFFRIVVQNFTTEWKILLI